MDHRDFIAGEARAAVFTPSIDRLQVASVTGELLRQLPELDGDPMVLPVPAEAPPELPRIVLRDAAESLQFQVAVSRSDLYLQRQGPAPLDTAAFFNRAAEAMEVLLGVLEVRPGRLAATGTYYYICSDPAEFLVSRLAKEDLAGSGGPLSGLRAFELHTLRRFDLLEGLSVNSWTRCKAGSVTEAGRSRPAVVLERDLNTLPEEIKTRHFSGDDIRAFLMTANEQFLPPVEALFSEES